MWPTRGRDVNVGRVAGQARAGQTILHDAERCGHHAEYIWLVAFLTEHAARQAIGKRVFGRAGLRVQKRGIEPQGDRRGRSGAARLAERVGVEIDRDDQIRPKRPASRDRQGVDERAIGEPALVYLHWREKPRQ